jgi:hypothetical protein
MKSPIVLLISLIDDIRRLMPDVEGLDRDIITIENRVEHEGISFLTVTLPALCKDLESGLSSCKFTCPRGFGKVRGGAIPKLFSGMLCKVFDSLTGELIGDGRPDIVRCLREVLLLNKKLSLGSDRDSKLDRVAKEKFYSCEDAIIDLERVNEKHLFTIDRVCRYILPNLDTFEREDLCLKHGPGAVAEMHSVNQKWEALLFCQEELEEFGYDAFFYASYRYARSAQSNRASSNIARLVTVLKDSSSRRTITVEPVVNMFRQQGYNTYLRDSILKCNILSQCLQLSDQSINQKMALEGSITGEWSTLDLSSASDLLSLQLVERVFMHRPRFLSGILECRTPQIMRNNVPYTLKKFAGMGNATTFPVQSVVFAVLAIAAGLDGLRPSYRNVMRVARNVRVYGDDIIVRSDVYRQVVSLIEEVGLKVNLKKSFSTGNFRESCGLDAYHGVEVTPLYVRHCISEISVRNASIYAHFVSLCNHAWMRGLYNLSETIRQELERERKLPLVSSDSPLLGLHTRQNVQEYHRWCSSTHRFLTKGLVQRTLRKKDPLDGYAALLKFFHLRGETQYPPEGGYGLQYVDARYKTSISQRWVAP